MKAKLVEKLEFTRGAAPKSSLGIGMASKIKQELNKRYTDKEYEIREYIYISPDFIIIKYNERLISGRKEKGLRDLPIWIIKYDQISGYEAKLYSTKGSTWIDERTTYNYAAIYEKRFRRSDDPTQMTTEEELMIKISTREDKKAMEKCEIMADALNEKLGPIEGFQLIEEIKVPLEEYEDKVQELQNKGSI